MLDDQGALGGLPLMPEMLEHCGKEFTVYSRADKTCDTIDMTGATRRMENTVHLSGLRCDGSAHGGCQAGCLFFWREEWLDRPGSSPSIPAQRTSSGAVTQAQRTAAPQPVAGPAGGGWQWNATGRPERQQQATAQQGPAQQGMAQQGPAQRATVDVETLHRATVVESDSPKTIYRCQATEVLRASDHISALALGQYVSDVRTGNERLPVVLRGLFIMLFNKYQWRIGRRLPKWLRIRSGQKYPFYQGTGTGERTPVLDLQPGELVEVKSKEEIMATLSPENRNRGMWFDGEMLPYVGKRFRVAGRVERIIHEQEGRMIKLSDCVVLEGVICAGIYHRFCQRAVLPYWREAWLRRVVEPETT